MWQKLLISTIFLGTVCLADSGGLHQDSRCNCICPDTDALNEMPNGSAVMRDDEKDNFSEQRTIYRNSSVTPDECTCKYVVLVHMNLTEAQADSFCPR